MDDRIPFNRPYVVGTELHYVAEALQSGHTSGNGAFTSRCARWLEETAGCAKAIITPSCTAALEMTCLLARLKPGDEVIMPSFTFVSTANAFALHGVVPVFIDVRDDTLNIDERLIEDAITQQTKAIVVVHYAGVACAMEQILDVAARHSLMVIEDAAQGVLASYHGRPLGTFGQFGTLSFHETKNIHSGEGGALLINDPGFADRAEVLQEKGTNRSRFFRGEVDKYTWVDIGSSYLMGDITAAFLWAQLEHAESITRRREAIWEAYHEAFLGFEDLGIARRPVVPAGCHANSHLYYLRLPGREARDAVIDALAKERIQAVFHYVPLHSSPAGRHLGRVHGDLPVTERASDELLRLPLWVGMRSDKVDRVVGAVYTALKVSNRTLRAASAGRRRRPRRRAVERALFVGEETRS